MWHLTPLAVAALAAFPSQDAGRPAGQDPAPAEKPVPGSTEPGAPAPASPEAASPNAASQDDRAPAEQEPEAPPPPAGARYLDFEVGEGVVAVVGRELIRRNDVLAAAESGAYEERIPGLAEAIRSADPRTQENALKLVLLELIFDLLKTEGGRNQGYDPEAVTAILERRMDDFTARMGGAAAATQALQRSSMTPRSYMERTESLLLERSWTDSVTGRAPGPTGRAYVDRYVPPGLLASEYEARANSRSPAALASLGAAPRRFRLEQVVLGLRAYETLERAEALAERIREDVEGGAMTMEAAARQFSQPAEWIEDWQLDPMDEAQLNHYSRSFHGDLALAEFALGAEPGAVSAPIRKEARHEDGSVKLAGLFVYRLAEVLEARGPEPFESASLQERLRREIVQHWDDRRIDRGLHELIRATYVWPPELAADLRGLLESAAGVGVAQEAR